MISFLVEGQVITRSVCVHDDGLFAKQIPKPNFWTNCVHDVVIDYFANIRACC